MNIWYRLKMWWFIYRTERVIKKALAELGMKKDECVRWKGLPK